MFIINHYLKLISHFIILILLFNTTINGVFGKLIELNDRNLDKIVKDDDRWMLQFYTENCKLCSSFRENLEKLSEVPEKEYGTVIKFGLVNADENPHLASRFMVTRNPHYFFIDKKNVHSFTINQTYDYLYEFLKYHRWKLYPKKEGYADPFSKIAYLFGYFNVIGYLLQKYVFVYIPAKIFYSIVIITLISSMLYYAVRKHREFEEYMDKFESSVEEKYYNQCMKYGYDPLALLEEMDKQLKKKKESKNENSKKEITENDNKKIQQMDEEETKEFMSVKGKYEKKND